MVDIETMKTIYDPCPAGYKISPPDVYGAFLKEPIIDSPIGMINTKYYWTCRRDEGKSFYTPSFTEYGAYFYCGGENSARKVYFISAVRSWRNYDTRFSLVIQSHLSGTMTSIFGDGMNTVMSFTIATHGDFYCSFGEGYGLLVRSFYAAHVRCVRDE